MNLNRNQTGAKIEEEVAINSLAVKNVRAWDNGGVTFDMTVNGITIYGMRVVSGSNGDFVSFPSRKGKDEKYYNHVYFKMSKETQDKILEKVSETWEDQQKSQK